MSNLIVTNDTRHKKRLEAYAEGVKNMSEGKARLNVLIDAELHRELKLLAVKKSSTLVELVSEAVKKYLEENKEDDN